MFLDLPNSNKRIADQITKMLESARTVHAFLFYGGSKNSREELGLWLSKTLLCDDEKSLAAFEHGNCADFIVMEKPEDRESILKDQILDLNEKLSFKPFGEKYVVLVKDAHLMNAIAQNKLLKGLEEPLSETVYILLAEKADSLLETINSRCVSFCLEEEEEEILDEFRLAAEEFAKLIFSDSAYYKKRNVIAFIYSDKDDARYMAVQFFEALERLMEKYMLEGSNKACSVIKQIEESRMYLSRLHSVAYTLKQFCLRV